MNIPAIQREAYRTAEVISKEVIDRFETAPEVHYFICRYVALLFSQSLASIVSKHGDAAGADYVRLFAQELQDMRSTAQVAADDALSDWVRRN